MGCSMCACTITFGFINTPPVCGEPQPHCWELCREQGSTEISQNQQKSAGVHTSIRQEELSPRWLSLRAT